MKNQTEKTETTKTKQFSVIVEKKEVLTTTRSKEAIAKVNELQIENEPSIIMIDNNEKKSTRYTKKRHERNYRIEAGNFESDSVLLTSITVENQE